MLEAEGCLAPAADLLVPEEEGKGVAAAGPLAAPLQLEAEGPDLLPPRTLLSEVSFVNGRYLFLLFFIDKGGRGGGGCRVVPF